MFKPSELIELSNKSYEVLYMHDTMIGYMFYLLLNFLITQSILQLSSPLLKHYMALTLFHHLT